MNGFEVIALDRPGYGGSDALPDGEVTFARNAEVLDAAITQLWADTRREPPRRCRDRALDGRRDRDPHGRE